MVTVSIKTSRECSLFSSNCRFSLYFFLPFHSGKCDLYLQNLKSNDVVVCFQAFAVELLRCHEVVARVYAVKCIVWLLGCLLKSITLMSAIMKV